VSLNITGVSPVAVSHVARVPALDAVRGVAIAAVVGAHSLSTSTNSVGKFALPPEVAGAFSAGQYGVQLFFALSGWLMFALYRHESSFSHRAYWARRMGRIWPLWIVCVLLYFAIGWVPEQPWSVGVSLLLFAVFLSWVSPTLAGVPVGGVSIELEILHYALFARLRRSGVSALAGSVIGVFVLWLLARGLVGGFPEGSFLHEAGAAWVRLGLQRSWPFFLLGGVSYLVWRRWSAPSSAPIAGSTRRSMLLVTIAVLLMFLTDDGTAQEPMWVPLGFVVLCVMLALALNGLPVLGPATRALGRYSYFIYFAHVFVHQLLIWLYVGMGLPVGEQVGVPLATSVLIGEWVITLVISGAAGSVSWRFFELPILHFARTRYPQSGSPANSEHAPA
jgi:peptidoglycan/LPS O-acetylase OafA/YrhL